jgi:prepilin-type N-terminal cleavage/methylation domain-containing protein
MRGGDHLSPQRGFTLVEVLFAIFMGAMLMAVAYIAMTSGQQSSAGMERKVAAQQDVRAALQVMRLELSMASYNPNYISGIWHDLPAMGSIVQCTASGNQAYKGIREAAPTSITIEMDLNENSRMGDPSLSEIVRYNYDMANQYITRETANCGKTRDPGAAFPFLGDNPKKGRPRTVRVINDTLGVANGHNAPAVFRYYDARNPTNELYPGEDPNVIPDIRRVDIALAVETDEVDPSTNTRKKMIYSTSVFVRNHGLNQ